MRPRRDCLWLLAVLLALAGALAPDGAQASLSGARTERAEPFALLAPWSFGKPADSRAVASERILDKLFGPRRAVAPRQPLAPAGSRFSRSHALPSAPPPESGAE